MGCCCCGGGGDRDRDRGCRPLGWLLGLPFALVAVLVSIVGAIIWIIGYALLCKIAGVNLFSV